MNKTQWLQKLDGQMMFLAYAVTEDKDLSLEEMEELKDHALEQFEFYFEEGRDEEEREREEEDEELDEEE